MPMSVGHGRVRGLGRQHGHMNVVAGGSGEGRCGLMVAVHRRSDDRGLRLRTWSWKQLASAPVEVGERRE